MGKSWIRSSDEHQKPEQGLARKSIDFPDWGIADTVERSKLKAEVWPHKIRRY